MLGDAECKTQIAQFGIGRRSLGHRLKLHVVDHRVVARLHQEPAGDGLCRQPDGARIGQAAGDQEPQIFLRADDGDGFLGRRRRDDDFGENLGDGARGFRIERPVECDDAAEGGDRIAGQRLAVGVDQAVAFGDAARDWRA